MRLQLIGISKYFPGVKALEGINFDLKPGEVHTLCGENGAGKSTLMNILTGNLIPDKGEIILNGRAVTIAGPAQAAHLGIAIVYQQLSLIHTLSVAENIFANTQPCNAWGLIDFKALYAQTRELLGSLQMDYIQPDHLVGDLAPGEKQMVEIAKALSKNPDILILDEPTASVTERETQTIFNLIGGLKRAGKSIIYISHRMAEIFRIADRVTVLKDGRHQGTRDPGNITPDELIRMMVGRELVKQTAESAATAEELLRVENLSGKGFENINITVHRGEIVGLAGLVGAGRTEIAQTIFGFLPRRAGQVFLKGAALKINHPADAIAAGIGYVPEERKSQGLFLEKPVTDNIVVASLQVSSGGYLYDATKATGTAETFKDKLGIITPHVQQEVVNLSGGNQQKVVLAKWLLTNPEILIVDEPTHGIDVGAKAEIYSLLRQLAVAGKGIIFISSELPEILALADRILVIREGQIAGEINGEGATEEAVLSLASL